MWTLNFGLFVWHSPFLLKSFLQSCLLENLVCSVTRKNLSVNRNLWGLYTLLTVLIKHVI